MELKIGKLIKESKQAPCYAVEVKMMHGDAAHYTTQQVTIPEEKIERVKEVIGVLDEMLNLPWNGAREKYSEMPGFLAWFGDEFLGDEEDENWDPAVTDEVWEEIGNYSFEWERDVRYLHTNARLDRYKVFYYDANGLKYDVEVIKTP